MSPNTQLHTTVAPYADTAHGLYSIDGQAMLFQSNHYNRSLQHIIETCRHVDSKSILLHSAAEVAFLGLQYHFVRYPNMTLEERLRYAERLYSFCGFGLIPFLRALKQTGGADQFTITTTVSHYSRALTLIGTKRRVAGEYFDLGFILGALAAIFEQSFAGELTAESMVLGSKQTTFKVWLGDNTFDYLFQLEHGTLAFLQASGMTSPIPPRLLSGNINEMAIIKGLNQAPLMNNSVGLIQAFGMELTRHYADYYNLITYRFESQLLQALHKKPVLNKLLIYDYPELFASKQYLTLTGMDLSHALFIEASTLSGFYLLGGIMQSAVWADLIKPMLQTREDWLYANIAVINALGWGVWRVIELIPQEKLVIRVWRPYESLGHLRWFGFAEHGVDYLLTGVSAALMNLLYQGDIAQRPALTPEYYQQINHAPQSFSAAQTQCVAMGHDYSEVVVMRRNGI